MWAIELGPPAGGRRRAVWSAIERAQTGLAAQLLVVPLFERHRIFCQVAGHRMNVVKALPALVIEEAEIRRFAAALEDVVADADRMGGAVTRLGWDLAAAAPARCAPEREPASVARWLAISRCGAYSAGHWPVRSNSSRATASRSRSGWLCGPRRATISPMGRAARPPTERRRPVRPRCRPAEQHEPDRRATSRRASRSMAAAPRRRASPVGGAAAARGAPARRRTGLDDPHRARPPPRSSRRRAAGAPAASRRRR